MNRPILSTKLYIPVSRSKLVPRKRLMERLSEGLDRRKLTLVSASAGFGKTTLVGEWAARCGRPAAWLSLDEGDNEGASFLTHLAAAVNKISESAGQAAIGALEASQTPSSEAILTTLLNAVSALPYAFVLVLDDYHVIHAERIHASVAFLLEHLPQQMHLVVVTREDPRLPLSRLRAGGHLTELRAADLRFTPDEAAAFLERVMGLVLAADNVAALESRTEGWIAGLQLAALSMQGRADIPAIIRSFSGDHRYIADYLVEEVLRRQPGHIRDFLLRTSVLGGLYGPLCDAVTGQQDGAARLEALERGNFFVVPLDDKRRWYRYHHLFAEMLAERLKADRPQEVAALHLRASAWHERSGSMADAIRHALAAEDHPRAADLIELAWPAMRRDRQGLAVLRWLRALPDASIRGRPVLSAAYAWALLAGGELGAVEGRLRDAERWLERTADLQERPAGMVVADEEEYRHLRATIAGYRSAHAQVQGDIPAAIGYARQVLELAHEDDHLRRGAASALLGLAAWTGGELKTAHRMFAAGMESVRLAGNISDAIGGTIALGEILIGQGRLGEAMRAYERGLQLAAEHGESAGRTAADLYAGLGELCRERGDLSAARQHLARSEELSRRAGRADNGHRWHVAMARLAMAEGDPEGALVQIREAERQYAGDFFPNVRPVSAWKARIEIAMGQLDAALQWMRDRGLTDNDDLAYLREFEHITVARALLAWHRRDRADRTIADARGLLDRLLHAAQTGKRTGSAVEILVLQALACDQQGDLPAALDKLESALALAGPEGYVRLFADEGRPMADLLEEASKQGIAAFDAGRLLAAFGDNWSGAPANAVTPSDPANPAASMTLSDREREVLRLLRTDLGGPDIARELHISLNTLRTHTKNIFGKLEVNNRRAAVRRAEELRCF
ncbi:LuxR C-terminal-related transcriptional regulator [Cohnella sp. JJ-181]|uniref:LuxR C-terminal-related transcriptional regulator n=1 Tax=Cohnella rhizoplanae TaxID=2974897 RepID=UPI0022FF60F9|nr:LuxR C-terminal-related transcriptional regulator [Cohnella sp. JJ-181]CAI6086786.1 HTH-type transcriptional regulator MalT [Cohnella sp. JJ-181]